MHRLSELPSVDRANPGVRPEPLPLLLFLSVFLPFVSGYFLSYYFRAVNAVLSSRMSADLALDAASIGLVTSAYFLLAAAAQIPVGLALDRFGPRAVQVPCLLVAAAGAALTAIAEDFWTLFVARSLIGLGVASALMAGLKAVALWFPRQRIPLVNGLFIGLGSLGVLAASLPTELALAWLTWRQLFLLLAALAAGSSLLIALAAPRGGGVPALLPLSDTHAKVGLREIYSDARFWRLAPLSAASIGAAWALQGLWAAPWLRDVAGLQQGDVASHLLVMACALSAGALGFGVMVDRLKRLGVETGTILATAALIFILAEVGLALAWPVSPLWLWSLIGAFGAGTVLSYSMTPEWFDRQAIGRANAALNLLHFGYAFAFQSTFGWVLSYWPRDAAGHYPAEAYAAALSLAAIVQLLALLWFLRPLSSSSTAGMTGAVSLTAGAPRSVWRSLLAAGALARLVLVTVRSAEQFSAALQLPFPVSAEASARIGATEARIATLDARLETERRELAELRRQRGIEAGIAERLTQIERIAAGRADEVAALKTLLQPLQAAVDRLEQRLTQLASTQDPAQASEPVGQRPVGSPACASTTEGLPETREVLVFARYQTDLGPEHLAQLERLAELARGCGSRRIEVSGFTDNRGSPEANQRLSTVRAQFVADALAGKGVARARIAVEGRGAAQPLAPNDTEQGRDRNRRVEVILAPAPSR